MTEKTEAPLGHTWVIIHPRGDKTRLTTELIHDYEKSQYALATERDFLYQEDADAYARVLARRHNILIDGMKLDDPDYPVPAPNLSQSTVPFGLFETLEEIRATICAQKCSPRDDGSGHHHECRTLITVKNLIGGS